MYDAAGQKLSVTHQTAVAGVIIPMTGVMTPLSPAQILQTFKTDYCGNVIYENGAVSRILTEEGYITFNGTTPVYHYYLKDHQGNNRVVLNQDGTVEQVNHYYPFGGLMGESTAGGVQPYKYNGKELDRMHGLDLFDYGARHYDAAIGRWWTMDPLAGKYYGISPYAYVANSPVKYIDLLGKDITLSGALSQIALQEMQKGVGNSITLNWDKNNGYISYTINDKNNISLEAKLMMSAVDNKNIQINMKTVDGFKAPDGTPFIGGGFMGNTIMKDKEGNILKIVAEQVINPDFLSKLDAAHGKPGATTIHEVSEAYYGALDSQSSGKNASRATETDVNNPNSAYRKAHDRAFPQSPVYLNTSDGSVRTEHPIRGLPINSKIENNPQGKIYVKFYDINFDKK